MKNTFTKDLVELDKNLKSKKLFRLLKDIPGQKKGTIFCQYINQPIFIVPEKFNDNGGFLSPNHQFNLYEVEDDFKDFFERIYRK